MELLQRPLLARPFRLCARKTEPCSASGLQSLCLLRRYCSHTSTSPDDRHAQFLARESLTQVLATPGSWTECLAQTQQTCFVFPAQKILPAPATACSASCS